MVDLHAHTNHSDGTLSPEELVRLAVRLELEALAITDHDTFSGYDEARPIAQHAGLDLICGIEISTKYSGRSVHLLGYFLSGDPGHRLRGWILDLQASRHARNRELIRNLREAGIEVDLEDWYAVGGKLAGRPHLAALLVKKGYVNTTQQAFDEYLAETGKCFTARTEPELSDAIQRILDAGGLPSLPHPFRSLPDRSRVEIDLRSIRQMGLRGLEVVHSDHSASDRACLEEFAAKHALIPTGGSDFHGATKPAVSLGSGKNNNVAVPAAFLAAMRGAEVLNRPL